MAVNKTNKKTKSTEQQSVARRIRIDDRQCRIFLSSMREFGYPSLTFDDIRKIADDVAEGSHSETDVIAVILCNQIDEAKAAR